MRLKLVDKTLVRILVNKVVTRILIKINRLINRRLPNKIFSAR